MAKVKEEKRTGYLATVQERDIDLLLMEEFHITPAFVAWFAERCGILGAELEGAWHSVTDADGETDLLLHISSEGQRIALLIENKIAAPEQERQDERYHIRAARRQMEEKFNAFVTCICAPEIYLAGLSTFSAYQVRIPYEDIRDWFAKSLDSRSRWRTSIIEEAIAQGRRGYRMVINMTITQFQQEFWAYLNSNHPELFMRRPTPKGSKSNWIMFRGVSFGPKVQFTLKMDQKLVELGFRSRTVSDVMEAFPVLGESVRLKQVGKTAALQIDVPPLDQNRSLADQHEALAAIMAAANKLLPYANLLI